MACAPGYAPNRDYNGCDKIPAEHLTWDSPWAIVPLVFTALGVTATLFTLTVFLRYNRYKNKRKNRQIWNLKFEFEFDLQYTDDYGIRKGIVLFAIDWNPALLSDGHSHLGQTQHVHMQRPQSWTGIRLVSLLQFHTDENQPNFKDIQSRIESRNQETFLHVAQISDCHLLRSGIDPIGRQFGVAHVRTSHN